MRWKRGKLSKNLEDRRFQTGGRRVSRGAGLGWEGWPSFSFSVSSRVRISSPSFSEMR